MLKVAIVGCGKIADDHASQIRRIPGCTIAGVCDAEPLMARQFQERFGGGKYFSNLQELLYELRPDVVHVCTPPQSHFEIAKLCIEAGSHVYVEKPFALCLDDTRTMIASAVEKGVKITAGHDDQFRNAARRMRALVKDGFLGSGALHMESYYCYELGGSSYAKAILGDKQHWVRRLPGKLLHNIISHGIARIAEFIACDTPHVIAHGFTSRALKDRGENEIIDELRVIVSDNERATAYFTFSSQMRPALHQFRIYGEKNGLILDQDHETLIRLRGKRYVSYAEKFLPSLNFTKQYLGNFNTNLRSFLARDFQMKSGMKYLIESFYKSILADGPEPIPYREIILTARIMDEIFEQLPASHAEHSHAQVPMTCA
jgi:predicted dehydrogenase